MLKFNIHYGKFAPLAKDNIFFTEKLREIAQWHFPATEYAILPHNIIDEIKVRIIVDVMDKYKKSMACIYHCDYIIPSKYHEYVKQEYEEFFRGEPLNYTIGLIYCGVSYNEEYETIEIDQCISAQKRQEYKNIIARYTNSSEEIKKYKVWKSKFFQSTYPICERYIYEQSGC